MQYLEKQEKARNPSWWKPGQSGNPKGRPLNPEKRQLANALRAAAKQNGNKDFLYHIADLAYKDRAVALAVLDKLVPDSKLSIENDESNGFRQLVIIRPEATEAKNISKPICI